MIGPPKCGNGCGVARIERDRLLEHRACIKHIGPIADPREIETAQVVVIRIEPQSFLGECAILFDARQFDGERAGDVARDLVLYCEDVGEFPLEMFGPELQAPVSIGQVHRHPYPVVVSAHAADDDVSGAQLLAQVGRVRSAALEFGCGVAGEHGETGETPERSDDVPGDAIAEIVLAWVAAEIGEGQDGDGWRTGCLDCAIGR